MSEKQTPHKPCSFCGEGVVCEHGYCNVCQSCRKCDAPTKRTLTNLEKRHAARTKLMMKFWSAMHLAGFPKEQEWEAQEKISIAALTEILNKPRPVTPAET